MLAASAKLHPFLTPVAAIMPVMAVHCGIKAWYRPRPLHNHDLEGSHMAIHVRWREFFAALSGAVARAAARRTRSLSHRLNKLADRKRA